MTNEVLLQLSQGKLSPNEAFRQMYPAHKPVRVQRAHWIKLRIVIPEERGLTRFLAWLFLFPIPFFMIRMVFRFVKIDKEDMPFTPKELVNLIAVRGILINVNSHTGEKIYIKTL